jgi:uncharacterized membrane protein YhhN
MNSATTAAIAATLAALIALLIAERRAAQRGVSIAKPLASLGFIAVAWGAGALDSHYGRTVLFGLSACALGDVLLIPRGAGRAFLGGMASFALGHAAYAVAFLQRGTEPSAALLAAVVMAVVVLATLRWLGPRLPPDMRIPIRVYIAIISAMVVLAVGASAHRASAAMASGAILFAVSDLAVARERFVRAGFVNQLWGLPLYYGAQIVLACSVATSHP